MPLSRLILCSVPRAFSGSRPCANGLRWRALLLALIGLGFVSPALAGGTWSPLARTAPGSVGLMMLLSDGTVLAADSGVSNACYRLTPDAQGSYVNGTWTTLAPMISTRLYYSSQVLKDGRVFVAGGEYGTGKTLGETYDPLTNTWTAAPPPGHTFSDSNSEILPDGRVLVALVEGALKGTILFDPVSNTWTLGPNANGIHNESAWVKLPDDSVLMVDRGTRDSERYIPSLNQWVTDATVPVDLYDPWGLEKGAGLLLPNGNAFFLGSLGHTAIYTPSGSTAPGSWVAGPDIPNASGTPDAPAAMLVNGKILCAVSPLPSAADHFPSPTTFYEYDYVANAFTSVPTPTGGTINHACYFGTMLDLPNGTVLYSDFNSQIYSYQPDGAPLAAGKPAIASITPNGDDSYHLTGTQLNGISQGASYGDDNQMATNYPIVRLTSGSNVYYARTYNWSSTSVMTGNAPVTTEFTLPPGIPGGAYSLVVVANGIASDPVAFDIAYLSLNIPESAVEGDPPANGTVTVYPAAAADLVVNLASGDTTEATVPATVTIPAGQSSAPFPITIINDLQTDGTQNVTITATAAGWVTGTATMAVNENAITFPAVANKQSTDPAFTLAATANSGLPVTYSIVAGGSVASLTGNTVMLTGATGVVTIRATQGGGGSYSAAADAYITFAVSNASPFVKLTSSKTGDFSLGIRASGTLWSWGLNSSGQLGIGSLISSPTPVQVGTQTWQSVSAGATHAVAIRSDGTLWAWGANTNGKLGDGTTTTRTSPVQIGSGTNWALAAAAANHTIAIKTDGTLWAWGANGNGQVGQGSTLTASYTTPTQVGTLTSWKSTGQSLTAGTDFTLALQTDGTLWAWGLNSSNQLGDGTTTLRSSPSHIGSATTWTSVAAGAAFSFATQSDGTVWDWGLNSSGQLGDGTTTTRSSPAPFTSVIGLQTIVPGGSHTLATKTDGTLWAWGGNSLGQLGLGSADSSAHSNPVRVGGASTWQYLSPGTAFSIAARSDGSLWSWGSNTNGQLGYQPRLPLPPAPQLGPVVTASAGGNHTTAIKNDGSLWLWGSNSNGQLGQGAADSLPHATPVQVSGVWAQVSAGSASTLAVKADGSLWAWGQNTNGRLGDGSISQRTSPVRIGTATNWRSVSIGVSHTLAVKTDGTLWAWGLNTSGQLGDGSITQRTSPVQVGTATNWKTATASGGGTFSAALKTDGTLWTWGANSSGQLGQGTTDGLAHSSPLQIGTAAWLAASTGDSNVVAVKSDGTLWAWGLNANGQLGDGTTTTRTSPVQIGSDTHWSSVGGFSQTIATKDDGTLWAWGNNFNGQLGDGITGASVRSTPAQVGSATGWSSVAPHAASNHSTVFGSGGTLWCFGLANSGQTSAARRNQLIPDVVLPAISPAQSITFPPVGNVSVGNSVTLAATASSGLAVSYVVGGPATLSGNQLTVTGSGLVTVFAYQPGDNYWQSSLAVSQFINPPPPAVSTFAATSITPTSASLNGSVNPGGTAATAKFQRGTTASYGTDATFDLHPANGSTTQNASVPLAGLNPGTTYHFRLSATNLGGSTNGSDSAFTTIPILSALVLNGGTLTPAFNSAVTSYSVTVSNATSSLTVTPTTPNANCTTTARVNGDTFSSVTSGSPSAPLPLNVGANTVDVRVTAQDGVTITTYSIAVTRNTSYQDWAGGFGMSGPNSVIGADYDGDGTLNLVEWAFATIPTNATLGPLIVSGAAVTAHGSPVLLSIPNGVGGTNHFAQFGRRKDAAAVGLGYVVEFSADLGSWVPSGDIPTVVASDSVIEAVTVPFPATVNGAPTRFFHVRVTGP